MHKLVAIFSLLFLGVNYVFANLSVPNFEALPPCVDTIDIDLQGVDVQKGGEVCIDLVFNGFQNVNSLQFTINWDPSVLEFIDVRNVDPSSEIDGMGTGNFGTFGANQGILRFLWFDLNVDGEDAPDGYVVAQLCFKGIGVPGEKTTISITDKPLKYEAQDPDGNDFCLEEDADDSVCILFPDDLCVIASACGTRTDQGVITLKSWGGTPPYTVDIPSLGVVGDIIAAEGDCLIYDNLNPGSYTIIIRDDAGRDTTIVVTIVNVDPITISTLTLTTPKCAGEDNGEIEIDIMGGTGPTTISWSPINVFGETRLRDLGGGQYTVTVKDSLGCSATMTFDLNTDLLTIDTNILQLASCPGRNDGSIEVIPSGGTPFPGGEYDFTWSINPAANGRGMTSINDKVSGTGSVIVEDMAGCRDTIYFDIPPEFNIEVQAVVDSVECNGDSTARLQLIATTNGALNTPYFFVLSDDNGPIVGGAVRVNEYTHDSLWADCFYLQLVDASACTLRDTFCIAEPDLVEVIVIDADTTSSCNPGADGFLEVGAIGGNGGPLTYRWDFMGATSARLDNLGPGQYTVTVSDRKMCEAERTFTITGTTGPTIDSFNITGVGCLGDTSGTATVLFTQGDTTVTSFDWNVGKSGQSISGLGVGQYIVTITDLNGCVDIDTFVIDTPTTSLRITSIIIDTPSCRGEMDGFIQVIVDGGNNPYSFLWNTLDVDSILTNIGAGRYIIEIGDNSICPTIKDTIDIPDPPGIDIEILELTGVTCNDGVTCNGRAIARASGGPDVSLGYIFQWSNGEIGFSSPDTADMLCQDMQYVIVSNGNCSDTLFFNVPTPDPILVDFDASLILRPSCFGFNDGSISVVTSGGNAPRNVTWESGTMGNTLTNIGAGTYRFTIVDDLGCVKIDSVILNNPDSVNAFLFAGATRDISCFGGDDGRITIGWNGGNPGPATFSWSPISNVTDSLAADLGAGQYFITVTDSKGCTDTISHIISEPPAMIADFPATDSVLCFGEQASVTVVGATGGNGGDYTFSVNNGSRRLLGEEILLFAGNYKIAVFDNKGCSIDTTINISQPNQLFAELGDECIELELGDSIRLCFNTNIPLSQIDSIIWTPDVPTTDSTKRCIIVKPITETDYTLLVVDEDGCIAEDQVKIKVINEGKVFVPNIFNPGGSINPEFRIYTGKGVEAIKSMYVFDRWGEVVFKQENLGPTDGWNGRFDNNGEFCIPGVYVYVVEVLFKDGSTELRRGDLTLIR